LIGERTEARLHVRQAAGGANGGRGGGGQRRRTAAALGGGERVGELRHDERKLAAGSTRAERCRRWGLRGEPELCGSNGGGHGRGSGRARLGLLGPEREGGEGCRERVLREPKGKERSDSAVKMEKGRTARRVVAVALRAAVLGMRAGKRRRVARSRSVERNWGWGGGFGRGARCMAGDAGIITAPPWRERKNRGGRGME